MDTKEKTEWFEDWFDTPYYHILYKHRNYKEAESFIDKLIEYLNPSREARFLDLCCGKGRHSIYLNKKNLDVTGFDLSQKSIDAAKQYENNSLHFFVKDMRQDYYSKPFDYIVNLFTSFGYFENQEDNFATIQAASKALTEDGVLVIDFLNIEKAKANLVKDEEITVEGIVFKINKRIENNFIKKRISFRDNEQEFCFEESVSTLRLCDFEKYCSAASLKIVDVKGDYSLNDFNLANSDRLIIIAKKK
ncbi:MAG: class I SAM-dependent methyltransferase [Bacteroidota bacterium]